MWREIFDFHSLLCSLKLSIVFLPSCVHELFLSKKKKKRKGDTGDFLCVNLVAENTRVPTIVERENPIARKNRKAAWFCVAGKSSEWCFPLRMMEHYVASRADPRGKSITAVTWKKSIVTSSRIGHSERIFNHRNHQYYVPIYQFPV